MQYINNKMNQIVKNVMITANAKSYAKKLKDIYNPDFIEYKGCVLWNKKLWTKEYWNKKVNWDFFVNLFHDASEIEWNYNELEFNDYILGSLDRYSLFSVFFVIYQRWISILKQKFPLYKFCFCVIYDDQSDFIRMWFHKVRDADYLAKIDNFFDDSNTAVFIEII